MILLILSIFIVACAPPGVEDVSDGEIEAPAEEPEEAEEPTEEEPAEVEEKEEEPKPPVNKTIKPVCVSGTKKCKGDVLIQCKSGKLIRERDCRKLGCWEEKRCGECLPGTVKCDGAKLVTCSSTGKKTVKQCYTCINKVCTEPPENPEPFTCREIYSAESENSNILQYYSAFKKDDVDQQMEIRNDPEDDKVFLGYINSRGTWIEESKGAISHDDAIYLQVGKCYVNCIVQLPFEIELNCKGGGTVNVHIPQYTAYPRSPVRLLVAKDGSTYYLDSTHDGEGDPLTIEEALTDEHLARKAK